MQRPPVTPRRGGSGPPAIRAGTSHPAAAGRGESGSVIVGGLLKVVLAVLVIGLVIYEAGAIAINHFQLDDLAGQAAQAGASTPPQQRTHATVERAVLAALEGTEAQLVDLEVGEEDVSLTVSRPARVLLLDRIPPAEGLVAAERQRRADFR